MGKKFFLTKEELDKLSYDDFMEHRTLSVRKHKLRYFDELTLYKDIRFSEKLFANFDRWERLSNLDEKVEPNEFGVYLDEVTKSGHSKTDIDSYKLLTTAVNGFGRESWYQRQIDSDKKKLGESEYGIYDHNVSEQYSLFEKLFKKNEPS